MRRREPSAQQRWLAAHPVPASVIMGSVFTIIGTGLVLLSHALDMEPLTVGTLSNFISRLVISWCTFGPFMFLLIRRQVREVDTGNTP